MQQGALVGGAIGSIASKSPRGAYVGAKIGNRAGKMIEKTADNLSGQATEKIMKDKIGQMEKNILQKQKEIQSVLNIKREQAKLFLSQTRSAYIKCKKKEN